jgi:hypothetical protein
MPRSTRSRAPGSPQPEVDTHWRAQFEAVRGQHAHLTSIDLDGLGELQGRRAAIGRSLATFQLGETGTGGHLEVAAAQAGVSADHLAALRCFVAEEQEHARLLAVVLDGLGVPLRERHWTDGIFVRLRRSRTLRSEVLTLLVAEVVALSYYGSLRDGLVHPGLRDIFTRIHDDEVRHVDFHAETLPPYLRRAGRSGRAATRVLWNALVTGAALVVAWDHGPALATCGVPRRRFIRQVHRDRRDLDRRLFSARPFSRTAARAA